MQKETVANLQIIKVDTCGGQRVTGNNYENEKTKKETEMTGNECWNETREIKIKEKKKKLKQVCFLSLLFIDRFLVWITNVSKA